MRHLPFAKQFAAKHTARIFFEDQKAWQSCKRSQQYGHNDSLLVPEGSDPFSFTWPVNNLDVLLFNSRGQVDQETVLDFMAACIKHGARVVLALSKHGGLLTKAAEVETT